jgi:tRNA-specific 2-thiouridylase
VLRSEREFNTLVVGPRSRLGARHVTARGRLYDAVPEVEAKLRYRSRAVAAEVTSTEGGFELELREPVDAVAPGQVAVLYDDDVVVGAGIIERVAG